VETSLRDSATGLHRACESLVQCSRGRQRHPRSVGIAFVALLQRRLHGSQLLTLHAAEPTSWEYPTVRLVLNIIWFVLAGLWLAIAYTLAALICFLLIVTIPFGIASLRIAVFALWPFGKTVVKRPDAGVASGIGNILWFILCGWWLALGHLLSGLLLCLTVIGIPLGLANFKLIPVSLMPLGREIVPVEDAPT
jgi:uncharacterized membrane protein YccF (DUF307 family)